jgi:photosystem II stability/assembly factor-like uncharacterized protein
MTNLEGVALLSSDRGATWQQARIEPRATGIALATVPWPAGPDRGSVFLSGYRIGPDLLSGIFASSRCPAGPWWSTADGGRSWHAMAARVPLPPTSVIDNRIPKIVVADATGTLVTAADDAGGPLALLRSTDSGASWSRQAIAGLRDIGSIVADGRGWLALTGWPRRERAVILWSDNSGATWTESAISTGGRFPFGASKPLRLYRSPAGALVAFNGSTERGHSWFFSSVDQGRSWTYAQGFNRVGMVAGIGPGLDGGLVAVTDWGRVLRGDHRGTQWSMAEASIPVAGGRQISNVVFAPTGVIVAAHYRGVLHRSPDGGRSWHRVDSGLPDRQYALNAHCVGPDGLIVVAGSGGMLTRSIDNGTTWQPGRIAATTNEPR